MHITIDVPDLVSAALGVLPRVLLFREQAAGLPQFDVSCFDQLETHALALSHAHTRYLAANAANDEVPELAKRARKLRRTLRSDVRSLKERDALPEHALKRLACTTGHNDIAADLSALVEVFRHNWSRVAGRTGAQEPELYEAERLANKLVQAIGARASLPEAVRKAARIRTQAFVVPGHLLAGAAGGVVLSLERGRRGEVCAFALSGVRGAATEGEE